MITNITSRTVEASKPTEKPYEVRDAQIKGFLLRVQPSGVKTWYCEFKRGKRIKLGNGRVLTPTDARKMAIAVLADYQKGIDPIESRRAEKSPQTLSDLLNNENYLKTRIKSFRSGKHTLKRIHSVFKHLLNKKLTAITTTQLNQWKRNRLDAGAAKTTVLRDLSRLSAALNVAVELGYISENPAQGVKIERTESGNESKEMMRFLSLDEEKRLRVALNDFKDIRLKTIVLLALHTGARRGEILGTEWENVDIAKAELIIPKSLAKSGKQREIPLNDEALLLLKQWKNLTAGENGYVFPNRNGKRAEQIDYSWRSVRQQAGLDDFRFHDLRHTFISRLMQKGIPPLVVMKLSGHSSLAMLQRYSHTDADQKRAAVNALVNDFDSAPRLSIV